MSQHSGGMGQTAPIVIAGGGIGGLACALALAQRQFPVLLLEQAHEFGEIGLGLQVAPNALHVLDALGVGDQARHQALLIERMRLCDGVTGEQILDIACDESFRQRYGNPYAVAHRADIHGALLQACRALPHITLRNSARVAGYLNTEHGVTVQLADGSQLQAAALIGADGVHSAIRRQMLDDGPPRGCGALIYRASIPAAQMPRQHQHPWPTLWVGPGAHIIYYPVRDWSMFNFGATVVTGQTEADESSDAAPAEALAHFPDWVEAPLTVMRVPAAFKRYVIRQREPVERWCDGAVTLLGDAAHAMVQYIAQGAAMALEDALCLARAAEEVRSQQTHSGANQAGSGGHALFDTAFALYQQRRLPRATRVQLSAFAMDTLLHARGPARLARNDIFAGRSQAENLARLDWLYAPQRHITY